MSTYWCEHLGNRVIPIETHAQGTRYLISITNQFLPKTISDHKNIATVHREVFHKTLEQKYIHVECVCYYSVLYCTYLLA